MNILTGKTHVYFFNGAHRESRDGISLAGENNHIIYSSSVYTVYLKNCM